MKRIISLLVLLMCVSCLYGQSHKLAKSTAVKYDWKPGIVNTPEVSYGLGLGETSVGYSKDFIGLTNITGYQFSRNIKCGVGYGAQVHNGGTLFPLFFDVRFNTNMQKRVFFLAASGGCAASVSDFNSESRIMFAGYGGIRYIYWPKTAVVCSAGLQSQGGGAEGRSSFFVIKIGVEIKGREWGR